MKIVFSPSKRRPGCVLLQAAMGGTVPSETFHRMFPASTWLENVEKAFRTARKLRSLGWMVRVSKPLRGVARAA